MSKALDIVDGDTFTTTEQHALFKTLQEEGLVIRSEAKDWGWGHHDAVVVVLYAGKYYVVSGGGCSCEGSACVDGPFDSDEEAGHLDLPAGDNLAVD